MKNLKYYLLILLLSLIPLYNIYITDKLITTHDGLVHLARIGAYFKALNDGQIPVRWAGDLNYGYGMPLFNFMYQVPYFLSSIFLFLGFGLVNSFKIVLSLSYILSGIFMFAFAREFFKNNQKAFLVTVFYQFSSFRLIEVLERGSFGEVYTYAFLPLALFCLTLLFKKLSYKHFLISSVAAALLILSHNSVSLIFFGVAFLYILFFSEKKKTFIYGIFSLVTGILIASFYWLPAIIEHKYTYGDLFMKDMYKSHFPPFLDFFIPNLTNSESFQTGGISTQIGIFHVIAIFLSLLLILNFRKIISIRFLKDKKIDVKTQKLILFCCLLILGSLFLMQPVSGVFWQKISFLRQFQFPWRLMAVVSFASSLLAASFFNFSIFKKRVIYIIFVLLIILSTVFYLKPRYGYKQIDENYYWNFPLNTTYFGETDVIWSAGPAKSYPKQRVEVSDGEAKIKNFNRKYSSHTFISDAKKESWLVSHTQYFPGWRVYVNGKTAPIEFQNQNWRGEITFKVPKGVSNVRVSFEESKIRVLADIVSISAVTFLFFLWFIRKKVYET